MEVEQCESGSTFLDDVSKLVGFVKTHDNSFAEYIRLARMYLFGTPIRRKGAGFRRATPGCGQSLCRNGTRVWFMLTESCTQMHPIKAIF